MNVETLIYAYLAICTSMILFNCICIFVFRRQDSALHRHSSRLEETIIKQLQRLEDGKAIEESHLRFLRQKLASTGNLMAFDESLERLLEQKPEDTWNYIRQIRSVFTYLAAENKYRSPTKLAYFAYVICKYRIIQGKPVPVILDVMMELLQEQSLYCRENALRAIYSTGDCDCVLRALHAVDTRQEFHHAKLLTDGLLGFGGDEQTLTQALWAAFPSFSVSMRVVILDYIRFSGGTLQEELLQLLVDSRQDPEIHFSCIRYFGKFPYEPAFPLLIDFVERPRERPWEYAAIAATALASYPGARTVEVLKKALSSSNWYVRFNAAKSLEQFHLTYIELSDVLDSNDRYAREILQYRMDLKNAREEQEAALV